jgi:hypothetical protein
VDGTQVREIRLLIFANEHEESFSADASRWVRRASEGLRSKRRALRDSG